MRDWRSGIDSKPELEIYGKVHQALEPLVWWETAMRNPRALAEISNALNVLNGNVPSLHMERDVADCDELNNIAYHFIMDCAAVTEERAKLWDLLQDKLPLQICARLFNQADYDIYRDFFSGLVIDLAASSF